MYYLNHKFGDQMQIEQNHKEQKPNEIRKRSTISKKSKAINVTRVIVSALSFFSLFGFNSLYAINASSCKVLQWRSMPLSIPLAVNQETVILFNHPLYTKAVNTTLTGDEVKLINNNGALYLTAKKAFESTLYPVNLKGTHTTVMINFTGIKASGDELPPCYRIVTDHAADGDALESDQHSNQSSRPVTTNSQTNPVALTRYIFQQITNPRIAETNNNIYRIPMGVKKTIAIYPITHIIAHPKAQFQLGGLYGTLILLENVGKYQEVLDPRIMRGYFLSASFYPRNSLSPISTANNQTWLVLVSDRPFNEAMTTFNPWVRNEVM